MERLIFGALLGATIGFGIGYLGGRAGGQCVFLCNPYGGAVLGALLGATIAHGLGPRTPQYTPSPHLRHVATPDEFQRGVLEADAPVLVFFTTPRCRFCRRMEPAVHAVADAYEGRARVVDAAARELPEQVDGYGLRGFPTTILFRDGAEVARLEGYHDEEALRELLDGHVEPPAESPQH